MDKESIVEAILSDEAPLDAPEDTSPQVSTTPTDEAEDAPDGPVEQPVSDEDTTDEPEGTEANEAASDAKDAPVEPDSAPPFIELDPDKTYRTTDGKEVKGSELLPKSVYTNKTQELSEQRKAFESEKAEYEKLIESASQLDRMIQEAPEEFLLRMANYFGVNVVDNAGKPISLPNNKQPFAEQERVRQLEEQAKSYKQELELTRTQQTQQAELQEVVSKYGDVLQDPVVEAKVVKLIEATDLPLTEIVELVIGDPAPAQPAKPVQRAEETPEPQPKPKKPEASLPKADNMLYAGAWGNAIKKAVNKY